MWKKLPLRIRLNALFALVLALGLAINVGRLLLEAGPRVQAEDESVIRLAREFIEVSVSDLKESADPDAKLSAIVDGLQKLRHVTVAREGDTPASGDRLAGAATSKSAPPAWFVSLVRPEPTTLSVPITVGGNSIGSLVVASHPIDEIAEIWDGIITQIEIGSALAAALLMITMVVVSRALAPIQSLSDAMARIEAGRYDTRVMPTGSSEIADICSKLNHLAAALGNAVEDKRRLAERMVSLQDAERKEIARELHDEFGSYLFALRAHAASLTRTAGSADPDVDLLRKHGNAMLDQVNALQQFNRRVLERLRPPGLNELGLNEAVGALVRLWRDAHPNVIVETKLSQALGSPGETVELTIYRVVQEALTNVFRHSRATEAMVTIEQSSAPTAGGSPGSTGAVHVSVSDNGEGLQPDHKLGLGLVGMRERVLALGGTMTMVSTASGLTVDAIVPCGALHNAQPN